MNDFMGCISRYVYLPALYKWRGLDVGAWEQRARHIQSMAPQVLKQYQMSQLNELLRFACQNVSYYRTAFREAGIEVNGTIDIETFQRVPILTKALLRENFEELASAPERKGRYKNMTGGSTGTPVMFLQDAEYQSAALGVERCILDWWGVKPGDRTVAFWGADRELHAWSRYERLSMWLQREKLLDSFAMSEEKMDRFAGELMRWKPIYVKGYASSLHLFARFLLANPRFSVRPRAIRSTAETLFDWQRNDIEAAFGCNVYNFYGSREINNLAAECSCQGGLHILAGTRVVEVVDVHGNRVNPGEIGRIIVTDLVNRSMPFLRYENGDLGMLSEEPCRCGLPYPLLKNVTGRISDILIGKDGQYVHGEFITHLFYEVPAVHNFQLIQHDTNHIELLVQVLPKETLPDLTPLIDKILARLGDVSVELKTIEGFSRNSSGKHRFIVSKISPFQGDRIRN